MAVVGEKLVLRAKYYGGARRSRTADLLNAIQALSQLSYGPLRKQRLVISNRDLAVQADR